jgi:hypothetical protein
MYTEIFNNNCFVNEQTVSELAKSYERALPAVNSAYAEVCDPRTNSMGASWYGGLKSKEDAAAILANGWTEGASKASKLRDELGVELPRAKSRRRRKTWSHDGSSLSVDRALAGQWDRAFRSTERELSDGSSTCVTLVAGWGGNCNRTSEELFWSGAVMLVLCDLIEEAGQSVKLCAVAKGQVPNGNTIINSVVVKDHGEPLRIDALAGIVCHAGIFRSFGFRAVASSPWDVGYGLGRSVEWAEADRHLKATTYLKDEGTIRVSDCYSRTSAIAEIKRVVALISGNRAE